ncbi:hypothetical protein Agub_g14458 [Astrephomene gubernaculifera]|uniref:Uncharacterized protein n=1 Tax=Astrephomene gubernaculifera TaxID=47775 RepID=A0AAD3HT60_9CHLO|nr:hypothetical protein Agub_g14458 [Astrephomene gubernaculifera]
MTVSNAPAVALLVGLLALLATPSQAKKKPSPPPPDLMPPPTEFSFPPPIDLLALPPPADVEEFPPCRSPLCQESPMGPGASMPDFEQPDVAREPPEAPPEQPLNLAHAPNMPTVVSWPPTMPEAPSPPKAQGSPNPVPSSPPLWPYFTDPAVAPPPRVYGPTYGMYPPQDQSYSYPPPPPYGGYYGGSGYYGGNAARAAVEAYSVPVSFRRLLRQ